MGFSFELFQLSYHFEKNRNRLERLRYIAKPGRSRLRQIYIFSTSEIIGEYIFKAIESPIYEGPCLIHFIGIDD